MPLRFILFLAINSIFCGMGILYALYPQPSAPLPSTIPLSMSGSQSISTLDFLALGDIMLSRGVHKAIEKSNTPHLPFSSMEAILRSVDFSLANFESPVSGSTYYGKDDSLVFNTKETSLKGLLENKITVLNLANNHILDQKVAGLEHTLKVFQAMGFTTIGVGSTKEEAWKAHIIEKDTIRIAFIGSSYTAYNDGGKRHSPHIALLEETSQLEESIHKAKTQADIVIVSMHAGKEYTRTVSPTQQRFARNAIDFGADMVIGTHPHWIQPVEHYKEKYIFYSLGNFIFDQSWSTETKEGLVLHLSITKVQEKSTLHIVEYIPVIIEHGSTPRPANEKEKQRILAKINL